MDRKHTLCAGDAAQPGAAGGKGASVGHPKSCEDHAKPTMFFVFFISFFISFVLACLLAPGHEVIYVPGLLMTS